MSLGPGRICGLIQSCARVKNIWHSITKGQCYGQQYDMHLCGYSCLQQIQIFLIMLYKYVVFHTNNGALLAIGRHVVLNLVQSMLYK